MCTHLPQMQGTGFTRKQFFRRHCQNVENYDLVVASGTTLVEKKIDSRVVYVCLCCPYVFNTLDALGGHVETHPRKYKYGFSVFLFFTTATDLSLFFFFLRSPSSASSSLYASLDQDGAPLLLPSTLESSTTDV